MSLWTRALWLAAYAAICAIEFVVEWAKDAIKAKLKGAPGAPS